MEFRRFRHFHPQILAKSHFGKGNLWFQPVIYAAKTYTQYFSSDYGRTWPERRVFPSATNGQHFHVEGNALVDRDENGVAALRTDMPVRAYKAHNDNLEGTAGLMKCRKYGRYR